MEHEGAGGLALWVEQSALGALIRESLWIYPAAGVMHVWGVGILLGSVLAFDLRLLGLGRAVPLPFARVGLLALARIGFVLLAASGITMLVADANHLAVNEAFLLKLGTIALALGNVLLFHRLVSPDPAVPVATFGSRIAALVSLLAWFSVAALGRLIAYT